MVNFLTKPTPVGKSQYKAGFPSKKPNSRRNIHVPLLFFFCFLNDGPQLKKHVLHIFINGGVLFFDRSCLRFYALQPVQSYNMNIFLNSLLRLIDWRRLPLKVMRNRKRLSFFCKNKTSTRRTFILLKIRFGKLMNFLQFLNGKLT